MIKYPAICLATVLSCLPVHAASGQGESAGEFAIPDVPDTWRQLAQWRSDSWSLGLGLGVLLDYTNLAQDQASIEQVGRQEDELEFRSFRFFVRGTLDFLGPVSYLFATEYKGFGREYGEDLFNMTDLALTWTLPGEAGRISFGKQKEPFVYEMAGDAANLPHHERLLSPFFSARNTGIRYDNNFFWRRMSISAGWFNDWWHQPGGYSRHGNVFSARLTALPVWRHNGDQFLHVGLGLRYLEGDDGLLRYVGQPGSHVTDPYVDTGTLEVDHAIHKSLEVLWSGYRLSVLAEYARADVSAPELGNPELDGYYVTVGFVFNGNLRFYDQDVGYARRISPYRPWGALEPIVRYGKVDLDDALVTGGTMEKWYLGLNWWATSRWKASVGYGDIALNRFGLDGTTRQWLFRLQWIGP